MRGRRSRPLPDISDQRVFEVVDRCRGGVLAQRPDAMSASNRSHLQPSYAHYSLETSRYVSPETSLESTHSVTPDTGEGIHLTSFLRTFLLGTVSLGRILRDLVKNKKL